jgi:hypothetical protein
MILRTGKEQFTGNTIKAYIASDVLSVGIRLVEGEIQDQNVFKFREESEGATRYIASPYWSENYEDVKPIAHKIINDKINRLRKEMEHWYKLIYTLENPEIKD